MQQTSASPPARQWSVDLGPAGVVAFRFPGHAVAGRIQKHVAASTPRAEAGTMAWVTEALPMAGVVLGACWADTTHPLATPWPTRPVDPAAIHADTLTAYGLAVVAELEDRGWNPLVIARVMGACLNELRERTDIGRMVADLAGFTPPQAPPSTVSA